MCFFFKQKTAYELRISDWSSDVCSSDLLGEDAGIKHTLNRYARRAAVGAVDSYGETALKLVSDTIRGWDAKTITDRLENAVGDDLQYIRINGDRKSTRLNSSHSCATRMPSSA